MGGNPLKLSHFRTTVVENSLNYSFFSFQVCTVDENPSKSLIFGGQKLESMDGIWWTQWMKTHEKGLIFEKIAAQRMNIAVKCLTLDSRNK